jgi:hypothetical protein
MIEVQSVVQQLGRNMEECERKLHEMALHEAVRNREASNDARLPLAVVIARLPPFSPVFH